MVRNRWVDVSLDWLDYVEARVEALVIENDRLKNQVEVLQNSLKDLQNAVEVEIFKTHEELEPVSRLLVRGLSLPPATEVLQ